MTRKVTAQPTKKTDDPRVGRVRLSGVDHRRVVRTLLAHPDPSVRAAAEAALDEALGALPERSVEDIVVRSMLERAALLRGGMWGRDVDAAESVVRHVEALSKTARGAALRRRERDRDKLRTVVFEALRLLAARARRGRPRPDDGGGSAPPAVRDVLVALGLRPRGASSGAVRKVMERLAARRADDGATVRDDLHDIEEDAFSAATDELSDLGVNLGRLHALLVLLNK
jgi:hypothetical protein